MHRQYYSAKTSEQKTGFFSLEWLWFWHQNNNNNISTHPLRRNIKQIAELFEGDVVVEFAGGQQIVLDHGALENRGT